MLGRFGKVCFSYTFSCRLHAFPVRRTIFVTSSNLRSSKFCYVSKGSLFSKKHPAHVSSQYADICTYRLSQWINYKYFALCKCSKWKKHFPPGYTSSVFFSDVWFIFHKFHRASLYTGIMCCFAFSRLRRNCTETGFSGGRLGTLRQCIP